MPSQRPQYLRSRLVRLGLGLLVVGTGPLLLIILAAAVGLTGDPNPNPVGPGILAALTFWPAVTLLVVGMLVERRRALPSTPASSAGQAGAASLRAALGGPVGRTLIGLAGILLVVRGLQGLRLGEGRGAAAALVLGAVGLAFAALGRIPGWFRR